MTEIVQTEFIDRTPTSEEVLDLLRSLPDVWGVPYESIADYVQGLPSKKKIGQKVGNKTIETWHEVTTLYVSVAGRVHMARVAAEKRNWRIDFEPEPVTPTGAPGMLQMDDRIVYREYCLAPETRVLTTDLLWQPVETLVPGDTLVGFDEHVSSSAQYRMATVEATRQQALPSVIVRTTDGDVQCSVEHMWLVKPHATAPRRWVKAADVRPGWSILRYAKPWSVDRTYDAGWMSGLLDGEGSVRYGGVNIGQNPGPVLDRMLDWLKRNDYSVSVRRNGGCMSVNVLGGRPEMARLLGTLRPTRLMEKRAACWQGRTWGKIAAGLAEVVEVTHVGVQPTVAVQTDTRTLIAEGLLSHNCTIWEIDDEGREILLGRKPGMAWVPASGGRQAAGTNPYEKVETAARGRALAAWGFGVIPGSGIASLEEMQGARSRAPQHEPQVDMNEAKSPEERMEDVRTLIERVRQARDKTPEQMYDEIAAYAMKTFDKDIVAEHTPNGEVAALDLTQLKPGQVILLGSALTQTLKAIAQAETL